MSSRNEIYKEVTMTHKEKEEEDLYFDTIIIIKVYKLVGSYLKLKSSEHHIIMYTIYNKTIK